MIEWLSQRQTSMPDLSFSVGNFTVTPFLTGLAAAGFLSSFFIWRSLKEDVREDEIFNLTILIFVFAVVASRLIFVLANLPTFGISLTSWLVLNHEANFSLEGAFAGAFLAAFARARKIKINSWEIMDSLVLPLLVSIFIGGIGFFLSSGLLIDLYYPVLGIIGLFSFPFIKNRYRSFVWYKSGKTGFLFSFYSLMLSFFFLILAFLKNHGLYSKCLLGVLGLLSLVILYHRSERKIKEDLKFIKLNKSV